MSDAQYTRDVVKWFRYMKEKYGTFAILLDCRFFAGDNPGDPAKMRVAM